MKLPTAAILKTKSLTRRFDHLVAADSITIFVATGEVFGLVGPNGAGKTTVIKMLTTLLRPTSGTARVDGFDITRQAPNVRRIIGYVPQALSVVVVSDRKMPTKKLEANETLDTAPYALSA